MTDIFTDNNELLKEVERQKNLIKCFAEMNNKVQILEKMVEILLTAINKSNICDVCTSLGLNYSTCIAHHSKKCLNLIYNIVEKTAKEKLKNANNKDNNTKE